MCQCLAVVLHTGDGSLTVRLRGVNPQSDDDAASLPFNCRRHLKIKWA